MSWIRENNARYRNKYLRTYFGFRIYVLRPPGHRERIEERSDGLWRVTEFDRGEYAAVNKEGVLFRCLGLENIGLYIEIYHRTRCIVDSQLQYNPSFF